MREVLVQGFRAFALVHSELTLACNLVLTVLMQRVLDSRHGLVNPGGVGADWAFTDLWTFENLGE